MNDKERIKNIKKLFLKTAYNTHQGHIPSGLSALDIYYTLYNKVANITPENSGDVNRDRIIISKEHSRLAQLCVLAEKGLLSEEVLKTYLQNGGKLGHDIYNVVGDEDIKAVDIASGSLGHGPAVSVGLAWDSPYHIYCIVGDGELQEGTCWEAFLFAGHHNLKNLTIIVDRNYVQIENFTKNIIDSSSHVVDQMKAFGFDVIECDGHNVEELEKALKMPTEKIKCVVANTVKSKETLFIREREGHAKHHWGALTEADYQHILEELDHE